MFLGHPDVSRMHGFWNIHRNSESQSHSDVSGTQNRGQDTSGLANLSSFRCITAFLTGTYTSEILEFRAFRCILFLDTSETPINWTPRCIMFFHTSEFPISSPFDVFNMILAGKRFKRDALSRGLLIMINFPRESVFQSKTISVRLNLNQITYIGTPY